MTLILLVVAVTAMAGATLLRCSVPVAAPTAFFSVVLVLYAFGCAGALGLGFWVVLVTVFVVSIVGIVLRWRRSGIRSVGAWVLHPAMVVYLVMLGAYALRSGGLRFENWDEFSHWGRVVAAMVTDDALSTHTTADLLFASYPPGLPIWEYFLSNLRGGFLEADAFVACQALLFATALPFARNLDWRRPGHIAIFSFGAGLLMVSFFPLDSVLVDPVLAATFGYCATLALLGSRDGGTVWRHLGPALAVLTLLKASGALLALVVLVLLAVRAGGRTRIAVGVRGGTRTLPLWLAHLAVGATCVTLTAASWRLVVAATKTPQGWEASGSLADALGAIVNQGELWRVQTTTSFIAALSGQPITSSPVPMSFWAWFALSLALLVLVDRTLTRRHGDGSRPVATIIMLGGAVVYTAGVWLAYLTTFSEYEATTLASLARYLKMYWFAVLFVCAAVAADRSLRPSATRIDGRTSQVHSLSIAVLVALLSMGQLPALVEVLRGTHAADAATVRVPYDGTVAAARRAGVGPGDRVWILDEHTSGFGFYVLSYELLHSETAGWSVGAPLDAADIWTQDISAEAWSKDLAKFDFLVVHHTAPIVAERYGALFEDPSDLVDGSVFEVRSAGSEKVRLVSLSSPRSE